MDLQKSNFAEIICYLSQKNKTYFHIKLLDAWGFSFVQLFDGEVIAYQYIGSQSSG